MEDEIRPTKRIKHWVVNPRVPVFGPDNQTDQAHSRQEPVGLT